MHRVIGLLVLACATSLVPAAHAQDSLAVHIMEEEELFPGAADAPLADRITSTVRQLDQQMGQSDPASSYGRLGNEFEEFDEVSPIVPGRSAGTITTRYDVFLADGAVYAVRETPTSFQGDWHNYTVHYFRDNGTTMAVRRYSSFDVGCGFRSWVESRPTSGQEESLYVFDEDGRMIAKSYSITTLEGAAVDPETCSFEYRFPYGMLRTWAAYQRANGLGQIARGR